MLLINSFEGSFFPSNDSFKPLLFFFLDPIRASEIGHLIIKKNIFWRQGFTYPILAMNSLCSLGWLWLLTFQRAGIIGMHHYA